jgi:uncharacterized repeat protein (TIGR01451 family)
MDDCTCFLFFTIGAVLSKTFLRSSAAKRGRAVALTTSLLTFLIGALAIGAMSSLPASATAGTPGTPQAPTLIYTEDFENGVDTTPMALTEDTTNPLTPFYTGAAPLSETYTADVGWTVGCNGNVIEFGMPNNVGVNCAGGAGGAGVALTRQMAYALGENADAADPASNHAVTAYTDNNPGANTIELKTTKNIPLATGSGRFLTFSIDASALNCDVSAPLYQFSFVDGATVTPVGSPVNACTSTNEVAVPVVPGSGPQNVKVDTYTSNDAVLFDAASTGIQLTNGNGLGTGNDAAFDNIRLLDVTPQLDESFSPVTATAGDPSTLTFTVTNTTDLLSKASWSFTDSLPAGLTATGTASTTCPSGAVTAASGSGTVQMTGDLATGMSSCTITVDVTSARNGSYTNGPGQVTSVGLNPLADATVTFSGAPATPGGGTPSLPFTGVDVIPSTIAGLLLLIIGGLMFAGARRRRAAR